MSRVATEVLHKYRTSYRTHPTKIPYNTVHFQRKKYRTYRTFSCNCTVHTKKRKKSSRTCTNKSIDNCKRINENIFNYVTNSPRNTVLENYRDQLKCVSNLCFFIIYSLIYSCVRDQVLYE